MQNIIAFDELSTIRKRHHGQRIVFVTGVFDLTHPGHIRFLKSCKMLGNVLVVGVGNDTQVAKLKPGRPILSEQLRLEAVAALKPVDYCFIGTPETVEYPLKIVEIGLAALKPDIYAVTTDAFDLPYRRELASRYGVELVVLPYEECYVITTSEIIARIQGVGTQAQRQDSAERK